MSPPDWSRTHPPATYLCLDMAGTRPAVTTRKGNAREPRRADDAELSEESRRLRVAHLCLGECDARPARNTTARTHRRHTSPYPGQCSWSWNPLKSSVYALDATSSHICVAASANTRRVPTSTRLGMPLAAFPAAPTSLAGCCSARVTAWTRRFVSGSSSSAPRDDLITATTPSGTRPGEFPGDAAARGRGVAPRRRRSRANPTGGSPRWRARRWSTAREEEEEHRRQQLSRALRHLRGKIGGEDGVPPLKTLPVAGENREVRELERQRHRLKPVRHRDAQHEDVYASESRGCVSPPTRHPAPPPPPSPPATSSTIFPSRPDRWGGASRRRTDAGRSAWGADARRKTPARSR